jgi:hypothetical protein
VTTFDELWAWYGQAPRPANVADRVDGVALADVDDDVQDVASRHQGRRAAEFAAGDDVLLVRDLARLGLAVADLTRVLPAIGPAATHAYFARVAALGRAMLVDVARGT